MNLIDGNRIASEVLEELRQQVASFKVGKPHVVFVRVGDDPASISYVKKKEKTAHSIGIDASLITFPTSITQNQLLGEIDRLNSDSSVHGILVQAPSPIKNQLFSTKYHPGKMWMDFIPLTLENYAKRNQMPSAHALLQVLLN